jgi:hypothetical protein
MRAFSVAGIFRRLIQPIHPFTDDFRPFAK